MPAVCIARQHRTMVPWPQNKLLLFPCMPWRLCRLVSSLKYSQRGTEGATLLR